MASKSHILCIQAVLLLMTVFCNRIESFAQVREYYKNQIKGSPLRLFNITNPGVEFCYERAHSNYFSTQLSVAYLTDYFKTAYLLNGYSDYSGYRVLVEEKYFFVSKRKIRLYCSVDAGFYQACGETDAWFIQSQYGQDYDHEYRDNFRFTRKTLMLDAKFGMQFLVKRFVLDLAFGPGTMFQHVHHSDRKNPNDRMKIYEYPIFDMMYLKEGWNNIPNFTFNFKIGYAF